MRRQYVHLSVDKQTAYEVGKRKTNKPIILTILAKEAHKFGVVFYNGDDMVWLSDFIPTNFIRFPEADLFGKG